MNLQLIRFSQSSEMGTFGRISVGGITLYTVEQPWNDNKSNISCIPLGEYACSPRKYFKGGYDAVEIKNVPSRSHILFHRGNTLYDVRGCIAVGSDLGYVKNRWAVIRSKAAFEVFMDTYGHTPFILEIQWWTPSPSSGT
jgi:hypothetical protein